MLEIVGNSQNCIQRELTKKHKEYIRETISQIISEEYELKGEI